LTSYRRRILTENRSEPRFTADSICKFFLLTESAAQSPMIGLENSRCRPTLGAKSRACRFLAGQFLYRLRYGLQRKIDLFPADNQRRLNSDHIPVNSSHADQHAFL
jgi:hypothetical protein